MAATAALQGEMFEARAALVDQRITRLKDDNTGLPISTKVETDTDKDGTLDVTTMLRHHRVLEGSPG